MEEEIRTIEIVVLEYQYRDEWLLLSVHFSDDSERIELAKNWCEKEGFACLVTTVSVELSNPRKERKHVESIG